MKTKIKRMFLTRSFWVCFLFAVGSLNFSCQADTTESQLGVSAAKSVAKPPTTSANAPSQAQPASPPNQPPAADAASKMIDTNRLSALILSYATNDFPTHPANVLKIQADAIACDCGSDTNSDLLYAGLTNDFCKYALTDGSVLYTKIAKSITEEFSVPQATANDSLSELIYFALITDFPNIDDREAKLEASEIAYECSDRQTNLYANYSYSNLLNAFQTNGLPKGHVSATGLATSITSTFDINGSTLSNLVLFAVITDFPKNNPPTGMLEAKQMASDCGADTNADMLYTNLLTEFNGDALNDGLVPTTNIVGSITEIIFSGSTLPPPPVPGSNATKNSGTNSQDLFAQELQSFRANLDRLGPDLTVTAIALSTTNDITKVGQDLCSIGGEFSQVVTLDDLTNKLGSYLAVGNTTSSLENGLNNLETDTGQIPQTPSPQQVLAVKNLLEKPAKYLELITNDIVTMHIEKLPAKVGALGDQLTLLGQKALGPVSARTEEFITMNEQLRASEGVSNSWGGLFFWTGAKLLSPYTINSSQQLQGASGASAATFIELDFDESYVMRNGKYDNLRWPWASDTADDNNGQVFWAYPWNDVFDISGSFGYVFGPGNSTNSYSASTIVSTGDIYGRASVGLPVLRYCSFDSNWKQQLTLETVGGFATDKAFGAVHPNVLLGIGYQGKFPNFIGSTNLPVYWFNNLGPAWIDQPELLGTSVVFTTGNTGGLSEPEFRLKFVPICWQTKIIYPITPAVNIQLGGDVYLGAKPANWDITLGASLDLSRFTSSIESSLGLSLSP